MKRHIPSKFGAAVAVLGLILSAAVARCEDDFYEIPVPSLQITEGELPNVPADDRVRGFGVRDARFLAPYAVLDGDAEAYLSQMGGTTFRWRAGNETIYLRGPKGRDLTGALYVPNEQGTGLQKVKFAVPASSADAAKREAFYRAKEQHYERLMARRLPGSPWFRYQQRQAQAALAGKSLAEFEADRRRASRDRRRETQFEDTFQVFSGGRAVSENLQLDRLLPLTAPEQPTVDLETIEGITVAEMDWGPLTKDIHPETDPLAELIPSDQHALLFPSFAAMVRTMDEAELNGTPVLEMVDPRSESSRSRERYERQLCLSVTVLSRLLGDQVVASVAFTGSDPYLRTGTDVAILFEAKNAAVLAAHIATQQAAAIQANPECRRVEGAVDGVTYHGAMSPDRAVCSYMARIGKAVVVTNSLFQLKRVVETSQHRSESLASLPEYRFFRNRYPRGGDETGLLIVTDQTIRRWCGPKWRIAASRRTRAAAVMSHYQAQYMNDLVAGPVEPHDITTVLQVPDLGTLRLTKSGVTSSTYGTLEFQTPIAELELTRVTKTEAADYERWRQGYQRNWSQFFDPIAVRFAVADDRLFADLSVMPLIDSSDYREFIEIVTGAELKPTSGDPHAGSLLHWAMAINTKSERMKWADNFLEGPAKVSLLGWLGESISLYADSDPFWAELAETLQAHESPVEIERASEAFFRENLHRLPVAFTAEVSNSLKLTLFLSGIRAFVEQTAPGLLTWTSHEHNGQPYVTIAPTESGRQASPFVEKLQIHYAASPDMLVVTLNEDLLKRALDRRGARKEGSDEPVEQTNAETKAAPPTAEAKAPADAAPARPWLGKSMALQVDRKVLELFESVFGRSEFQTLMQLRAWSNIPVLNEWMRRYPDRDPVEVHQEIWQTRLMCPGGGKYVWNEEFQTMASTVYGHPGAPKTGRSVPQPLVTARALDFGITFEDDGLRARLQVLRDPAK